MTDQVMRRKEELAMQTEKKAMTDQVIRLHNVLNLIRMKGLLVVRKVMIGLAIHHEVNHHLIVHLQEKVLHRQVVALPGAVAAVPVIPLVVHQAIHPEVHPDQVHHQEAGDNSIIMI